MPQLASHLFYGDRFNIDVDAISTVSYSGYRSNMPKAISGITPSSLIAVYRGKFIEVGPRARLKIYRGFSDSSLYGIQCARINEIEIVMERVLELLCEVYTNEPFKSTVVLRRGRGVGVYEAPRGTLVHRVEINDEGRVMKYRIVVPTMFNIPVIEDAGRRTPLAHVHVVPRIFDPCIPCATHFVRVID